MNSIDQSRAILRQGIELLEGLPEGLYQQVPTVGSGMGPHLRHCIEFYRCFLSGLADGRVDYDSRARDPELEVNVDAARTALEVAESSLDELRGEKLERALWVRSDSEVRGAESWCPSSVGRELTFLVSHTVHHYALIAQVLRGEGFIPDEEFGLAPSTRIFRQQASESCAQ